MRRRTAVALLAVALGCPISGTQTYEARGSLLAVDREAQQLRIAHDEIPGLMPAMTMSFDVASPELLEGLEPGVAVHFELARVRTGLEITAIRRSGRTRAGAAGSPVKTEPARGIAPDFELIDQDGAPLRLSDLRGNAVLLDFIFTRCSGPCPILTSTHVALQRALPGEVARRTRFLSVSLDPEYDTPEVLRSYAEARGADLASWSFLTGEPAHVQEVIASYHVGSTRSPDGQLDHSIVTFLIDPAGRIATFYLGTDHPRERILADLGESLGPLAAATSR